MHNFVKKILGCFFYGGVGMRNRLGASRMFGRAFHRSAGALGCHPRMRAGFPRDRCMARDRPSPYGNKSRFFHRSAGACPPRSLECARHGEGQALALRCGWRFFIVARGPVPRDRCMARDRPSPYGAGGVFLFVARVSPAIVAWRGTGPRPTRIGGEKISFPFLMILCYNLCNGMLTLP